MFNYVGKRNIFFIISLAVVIAGIIAFAVFGGFNADIDFTGGYTMTVEVATKATLENADENASAEEGVIKAEVVTGKDISKVKDAFAFDENAVRNSLKGVSAITSLNVVKADNGFVLKFNEIGAEDVKLVKDTLANEFGQVKIISEDRVSASVGAELWGNASMALAIAAVLMLVYITFRFEFLSGVAAVIALIHDLLIMMSVYVIFQLPINTSFVAAMLTILGYSINATIVIFDRIRENARLNKNESFGDVTNKSISQSLTRAINTSITTLLAIVMVYILGVTSVKEFALPIIIGIVCGTYSSIFIAGPVWAGFKSLKKSKR